MAEPQTPPATPPASGPPGPPGPPGPAGIPGTSAPVVHAAPGQAVPYERFAEVVAERNEALARAQTLAAVTQERDALRASVAGLDEERALMRGGLADPEGVGVARHLHGRLPAEGRPTLTDWVAGMTAPTADPAKVPVALRGYLGAAAPKPPAGSPPPGSNGVVQTPPAAGEVTAAQVKAASDHGQRTGDWTPYRALRAQLGMAPTAKA